MEPPSHPEADDSAHGPSAPTKVNWVAVLVVGAIAALVILIVVLHLLGVLGPGAH